MEDLTYADRQHVSDKSFVFSDFRDAIDILIPAYYCFFVKKYHMHLKRVLIMQIIPK